MRRHIDDRLLLLKHTFSADAESEQYNTSLLENTPVTLKRGA